jgi:para-aminobenzoate synthetase component 1
MKQFSIEINPKEIRNKLLNYSQQFDTCFFYDSNADVNSPTLMSYRSYDILVALGINQKLNFENQNTFETLEAFQKSAKSWLFGYLSYDVKNEIEDLFSQNNDELNLPKVNFIEPQIVISIKGNLMQVSIIDESHDPQKITSEINNADSNIDIDFAKSEIKATTTQEQYINAFENLRAQIAYGNIYEINYCISFQTKLAHTKYSALYVALNEVSKAPFSAYVKVNDLVIICASPERFIKKEGNKLISQPIKGTAKRGQSIDEDEKNKTDLFNNAKERSENVMITDLVRNDLSKHAARSSVKVEELFGIYSFKQVHQMISTVSAQLNDESNYVKAIKDAFPMGSMTGAPKIKAMQLIEKHEQMKRGLYSGALGYIDPENNFDFNVLIRSIIINAETNKAQFCVGSAITHKANAEDEYQECLLKAAALFKVLA